MTKAYMDKDGYTMKTQLLTQQPVFKALQQQAADVPHLTELFRQNPQRAQQMSITGPGMLLDYSKQRVDGAVLQGLEQLFYQLKLPQAIDNLFSGAVVNPSENRPALHTQLRVPADKQPEFYQDIEHQLQRMAELVDKVHSGVWRGFSGKRITDVVNLGVGGSDLGPLMVTEALKEYAVLESRAVKVHFASTIDGSQVFDLLNRLNPETTLFLVVSKSFNTIDTLSNADTVRAWFKQACSNDTLVLRCHFIGISADTIRMAQWGIVPENQLLLWAWVGGRFSLWSSVGMAIALALGMKPFRQLLAGAHAMDQHFRFANPIKNIPVMMALLGIWNVNFLEINAHAILPYDGRLKYFHSYLEQLEMESNGKSVTQDGQPVDYATCPVLWGAIGANAQHAFYQLLHQGTVSVSADFIVAAQRYEGNIGVQHSSFLFAQHELNLANCLAQSRVLAFGSHGSGLNIKSDVHKLCSGNQPSSTLMLDELNPYTLGALVACYEHKVFTQAMIWGINPFDQWGVELGKQVALQLQPLLSDLNGQDVALDSSTRQLAEQIARLRA